MADGESKQAQSEAKAETKRTAQDFAEAYQKLCEQYGYRITVNPAFVARDDGSWSVVLQTSVGELPKPQKVQ